MKTEYRHQFRVLIMVLGFVAALAIAATLMMKGGDVVLAKIVLGSTGSLASVLVLTWLAFTRFAWKWRAVQVFGVVPPDISGRWEGVYRSSVDSFATNRPVALEVKQDYFNISASFMSADNRSDTITARLTTDADNRVFQLVVVFDAERQPRMAIEGDNHTGVALLVLQPGRPPRLVGRYFNDRKPTPRAGEIELERKSATLTGAPPAP